MMPVGFWSNLPTMAGYFLIVGLTCLTTAVIALFFSVLFRKTTMSLMASYVVIAGQFVLPPAAGYFADTFFPGTPTAELIHVSSAMSPVAAAFSLPLDLPAGDSGQTPLISPSGGSRLQTYLFFAYVPFTILEIAALFAAMIWLFNRRWRVSE